MITYRLITTILDPEAAPAAELAVLYCEHQEFELAEDEMKTHQRGAGVVLRSRTPEGVAQEICAYFLAHYAVRALMTEAALQRDIDPERLSFTHAINVIRRKTIAQRVFPPRGLRHLHQQVLAEILEEILPPRRLRTDPRVVKRKMSKFHVKRATHRRWPQPTRTPEEAARVLGAI